MKRNQSHLGSGLELATIGIVFILSFVRQSTHCFSLKDISKLNMCFLDTRVHRLNCKLLIVHVFENTLVLYWHIVFYISACTFLIDGNQASIQSHPGTKFSFDLYCCYFWLANINC